MRTELKRGDLKACMAVRYFSGANHHQSGLEVVKMYEKSSQVAGRDTQLAVLLLHKWPAEIEKAVDKIELCVVSGKKRTKDEKWWRIV